MKELPVQPGDVAMRIRFFLVIGISTAAALCGAACGGTPAGQLGASVASSSSSAGGRAGSGSAGSGGAGGGALASPPPPGPAHAPDGTGTTVFAVSELYLGDTDWNGSPDPDAWKQYGYNIDGLPPGSSQHCKPVAGASPLVQEEGPGGVQSSWGHNIMPLLLGGLGDFSKRINLAIASGKFTVLFALSQLGPGASYDPLAAQIAAGGQLGSMPKFDGTDLWPVIAGTQASFPNGYVVGDTWVSGPGQPIVITLSADGVTLSLAIHHPVVTMPLDAAHQKATRGIISGVIPTSPLIQQLQIALSPIPTLCGDDGGQSGFAQIAEASDILQDGTQDPTQTCDGISIGLGFDALPVQLGPTVQPLPQPFPCDIDAGDAGADGG
jgi:hypothetical protein